MSAPKVIFIDEAEFGLAAYDADDGLTKQVALRFTVRAPPFVKQWLFCNLLTALPSGTRGNAVRRRRGCGLRDHQHIQK